MSDAPPPPANYSSAPPPAPSYGAAPSARPGRTLGIVALVLAIVPIGLQLIGLILGIVALVQSKKAGQKNGIALAAIIVSAVLLLLGVIIFFAAIVPLITLTQETIQACEAAGFNGTVVVRGIEVSCTSSMR